MPSLLQTVPPDAAEPDAAQADAARGDAARADPRPTGAPAKRNGAATAVHERVLSVVASRICREDGAGRPGDACLEALCESLLASPEAFKAALARLRIVRGLGDAEIIDSYIPAIACQLGEDWTASRRSFVDVTIGTARLIAAVREITAAWKPVSDRRAPGIAMVVPDAEQHRLGAIIAASRFRRLGASVRLLMGCRDDEIATVVRKGAFDMLSFSIASRRTLEETRRLIHMLRDDLSPLPPIVVGGAIGIPAEDLKAMTGADHAATDPEEAMCRCEMKLPRPLQLGAAPAGP